METQEDGQLGAGTDDGTVNISLYRTRGVVGFPEAARPAGEQSSIMRRLAEHLLRSALLQAPERAAHGRRVHAVL